jgi:hypothetical protein
MEGKGGFGDVLLVTSSPHSLMTQGRAAALTVSMSLHTHSKSVPHVVEPTALTMQLRAHVGKMVMSWAETAVARAMRAVVYFILAVVVWGGKSKRQRTSVSDLVGHGTSVMGRERGEGRTGTVRDGGRSFIQDGWWRTRTVPASLQGA